MRRGAAAPPRPRPARGSRAAVRGGLPAARAATWCGPRAALVGAALVIAAVAPAPARAAVPLARCSTVPGDASRCARVSVPLDRGGALPGRVALLVRVLEPPVPPPAGAPRPPAIVGLAGGPGQAAAPLLERFADALGPAAAGRRVVAFDQRGTGASGRLVCDALAGGLAPVAAVAACARELGPRRAAYATAASVADLEAVRAALGEERIVLYGTSYGTKVALDYAAAHPQRVDRLVLDSVVPPAGVDPFQRRTLAAIPRVLAAVCGAPPPVGAPALSAAASAPAPAAAASAPPPAAAPALPVAAPAARGCSFTRDPAADVAALVRRLARRPLRGVALDAHGGARPAAIVRPQLLAVLLAGDAAPSLRAGFPAAVTAALHGDPAPLLRLAALAGGGPPGPVAGDSDAAFVATTCADGGVAWPPGTPPAHRAAAVDAAAAAIPDAAFAPFDRASVRALGLLDLCRGWPESPIEQPRLPLPPVPALILSGESDLRTPRADAAALARALPGAHLLAVPHTGHGVLGSEPGVCARHAVGAFLAAAGDAPAAPRPCDRRRGAPAPVDLAPPRLAAVAPPAGQRGRAARTLRAVDRTLDDALEQLGAHVVDGLGDARGFGGLRAGRAELAPGAGLMLHGYAYVPGVAVTGLVAFDRPRFALVVGGRAAAAGRLTVSRRGIAGRLGGRRVRASAAALGWAGRAARAAARAASLRGAPTARATAAARRPR